MRFTLEQIPRAHLSEIALGHLPFALTARVAVGALPPAFVAQRALTHLAKGKPEHWCCTFYIVQASDNRVVGGCGFKDVPLHGNVEIGYGVAPDFQGRGAATEAVRQLCALAFADPAVNRLVACILPDNLASMQVARKLRFEPGPTVGGADGEALVQWSLCRLGA